MDIDGYFSFTSYIIHDFVVNVKITSINLINVAINVFPISLMIRTKLRFLIICL